jgi:hypothetical protein
VLGVKGLRVRGARFEPRGVVVPAGARLAVPLDSWSQWASRSKLKPFVRLAKTVRKHKQGIVAYTETGLSNGVVEGLNNKIRLVMRRAYGFRNTAALKATEAAEQSARRRAVAGQRACDAVQG